MKARIDLVGLGRRPVGRELAAWSWRGLRVFRPSLLGIDDEARVDVHGLELPDAVLLHELVLVDRLTPERRLAGRPGHADVGAARASGAAVGQHGHDGLQVDVIVDLAFGESCWTECAFSPRRMLVAPGVDALQADLHRAVRGEQVRDVVPHLAIDVVAVGVLEIRDLDLVAETLGTRGEIRHARASAASVGRCGRDRGRLGHVEDRFADARRVEVEWRRLACGGPAGILVSARVLREVADLLDLPDAVLADVLVLVDATGPRGRPFVSAQHRHDVPAALARLAVGGERDDRLHGDVRVDASVGEAEAPAVRPPSGRASESPRDRARPACSSRCRCRRRGRRSRATDPARSSGRRRAGAA